MANERRVGERRNGDTRNLGQRACSGRELASPRADGSRLPAAARRAHRRKRDHRSSPRRRARHFGLHARNGRRNPPLARAYHCLDVKVEALQYGDRKVYSVAAFNRGVADWLTRLPSVWVEGEVTELRRHTRWQSVFFTLNDPSDGACLGVTMLR